MGADRADFRSLLADHEVTAFAALPHDFFALFEDSLHFDVVEKLEVAFFVGLFNGAHGAELLGEFGETFLFGGFGEAFVHVRPFVIFAFGGGLEVGGRVAETFEVLEPDLGVLTLVHGRFHEEFGDLLITFLAGDAGKVVVLVAGLGFTGKSGPEVLFGLGSCKLVCHGMAL